jgi:tetratricopeptide (TPR) repeat protein
MKRAFVYIAALSLFGCSSGTTNAPVVAQAPSLEIPMTSKSPEAIDHFKKGRALLENVRNVEAVEELNQALKVDPEFVSARAYLGIATPGPDGLKELEQASSHAAGLPEAERLLIDANLASRRAEFAKSASLFTQLTEKVPNDWRAHASLGQQLANQLKHPEAVQALRKATTLNPKAGTAFNTLGYESLRQDDVNGAIDAFKQYAALEPNEPNAQDSYGEALIGAGKFEEADAAFEKAATLSPRFWNAWEGKAYSKFFVGDWAGGHAALDKARAAASLPNDVSTIDEEAGFAALAKGDAADALKRFDAASKMADLPPARVAQLSLDRALTYLNSARYRDALTQVGNALQLADGGKMPLAAASNIRRQALVLRSVAEANTADAAAVEKTVDALQQQATERSDDPAVQSALHFARGMMGVAKKDFAGAVTHFSQCASPDAYCRWQLVLAADKAGDKAASQSARDQLLRVYVRDPVYLYVRSKVAPARPSRKTG